MDGKKWEWHLTRLDKLGSFLLSVFLLAAACDRLVR
jgi:hypothetical protein